MTTAKLKSANLYDFMAPYYYRDRISVVKEHLESAFMHLNRLTGQNLDPDEIKLVMAMRPNLLTDVSATMAPNGTLTVYPQAKSEFSLFSVIWHESAHHFSNVIKGLYDPKWRESKTDDLALDPALYSGYLTQRGIEEAGAYVFGALAAVHFTDPSAITDAQQVLVDQFRKKLAVLDGAMPEGIFGMTLPFLFHKIENPVKYVYQTAKRFFDVDDILDLSRHSEWNAEATFVSRLGNDIALAMLAENNFDAERTTRYFLCNGYRNIFLDIVRRPEEGLIGIILDAIRA